LTLVTAVKLRYLPSGHAAKAAAEGELRMSDRKATRHDVQPTRSALAADTVRRRAAAPPPPAGAPGAQDALEEQMLAYSYICLPI
jgi:hypothetical protein